MVLAGSRRSLRWNPTTSSLVRVTGSWAASRPSWGLLWGENVCVCVCVCSGVRMCVFVCVCVCSGVRMCVCVCMQYMHCNKMQVSIIVVFCSCIILIGMLLKVNK